LILNFSGSGYKTNLKRSGAITETDLYENETIGKGEKQDG